MNIPFFRGVIWPRGPESKKYRYVIIGMIVTDKPIEEFEGKNEIVLNGLAYGIQDILGPMKQYKPKFPLGTADSVLTQLDYIV